MSNIKDYTKLFSDFNRAMRNLKDRYSGFSYSSGTPRNGSACDSSTSGEIASQYILKASKRLVDQNKRQIMDNALDMMREDIGDER